MKFSVLDWLEHTASRLPDKIAYSDETSSVTFSQVLNTAKAIGSAIAEKTLSTSKPVAVISGRHIFTPVIFLGVVYSGNFYAPIDASMPRQRAEGIIQNLKPEIIITDKENEDYAKSVCGGAEVVIYDAYSAHAVDETRLAEIRRFTCETDPLYVIFTSGSTGTPKGVITSKHSLMCYINAYCETMGIDESDILGNQSPLDYIAAIRDIYLPLKTGASMFIIPKQYFATPAKLFDTLNEQHISAIGWSVSALTLPTSMGAFEHTVPQYLKKVCFSGSVMPCKCLRVWQENLPDTKFVNQYGPTEATASCTYYEITERVNDDDVLPIGIPYRNYKIIMLNEDNTETAQGEVGEICVSGPILALGYYNNPGLTAASFIQNPLNNSYREIIYKTGDLGVMRDDGILEFRGRKDRQVKHLGHRVELGEIEENAAKIDGVTDCCALYQSEKELLYLFYTGIATTKEIAVALRAALPGFMVPRKIINLDEMPRLQNGKTDMQTLKTYFKK